MTQYYLCPVRSVHSTITIFTAILMLFLHGYFAYMGQVLVHSTHTNAHKEREIEYFVVLFFFVRASLEQFPEEYNY